MKVMLYIRPKAKKFFCDVADMVFNKPEKVTYSDFNHIGDVWAGKYIYSEKYDKPNERFEAQADDILPRCRTLRKMPHELAYKLAKRYWNGMEEFFAENKFDCVFTIPVDCYTLDIIARVAEQNHVPVISFLGSPFAGLAKITLRGEYNKVRDNVSDEEVKKFVAQMTKTEYLSPSEIKNVKKTHSYIYKFHIKRTLIEYFYYPLLKFINKDPLNYHYNIFEVKKKRNGMASIPLKDKFDRSFEQKFKHIDEIEFPRETTVYYPMHLIPEATTDYWCPDIAVTNYEQFVTDMIKNADPGITFIIKEHPAMYGRRLLSFYDRLNAMPNVILLHPMDRSNNLLLEVDNVVVDNGTVGIEALMRGKRVIVLSDNYYYRFHPNAFRCSRVTAEVLKKPLQTYDSQKFMRTLLEGCFVSDFKNSTNGIPQSDPKQLAEGIKSYIGLNDILQK